MSRFEGRTVVVTGAGRGIGLETALTFAEQGAAHLGLVDLAQDRLVEAAEQVKARGADVVTITADLSDVDSCRAVIPQVVEATGRVDVLVSNAAIPRDLTPFFELSLEEWQEEIDVNLTASFLLGQAAGRVMSEAGSGSILYTISISALGAGDGMAHYCATKAGLVGLVQVMAAELASHGIRVNGVSPGPADTPRSTEFVGEEMMEKLRRSFPGVPMDRLVTARDVANAFAFLASDEAGFITGQNLIVDGGLTARVYNAPSD